MAALKILFMGTPELSCVSLEALLASDAFQIVGVVTQPDRPKGRALKLTAPPVKELALRHGLQVFQPERARGEDFIESVRGLAPELIVVVAYGQILPKTILEIPRHGCVNLHTSLLPRYRGAAPIQWAILNDDRETGVTIMKMDPGMDTGPILTQTRTPIRPEDDARTLQDRLARLGSDSLVQAVRGYIAGDIQPHPQPQDGVVYAPRIRKQDGEIDWSKAARVIWNQVRGLVPWPVAFTFLPGTTHALRVWEAEVVQASGLPGAVLQADKSGIIVACGSEGLKILTLQKEGGRRMNIQDFLAGKALASGQTFPPGKASKEG